MRKVGFVKKELDLRTVEGNKNGEKVVGTIYCTSHLILTGRADPPC